MVQFALTVLAENNLSEKLSSFVIALLENVDATNFWHALMVFEAIDELKETLEMLSFKQMLCLSQVIKGKYLNLRYGDNQLAL